MNGNKGEWSEPYVLFKLIADGRLFLGDKDFQRIRKQYYPIWQITRHEQSGDVVFRKVNSDIYISNKTNEFIIPIDKFVQYSKTCYRKIVENKDKKGAFSIESVELFLKSFSITSLRASSNQKKDITLKVSDPNTIFQPELGFSIKSQLGGPSTLLNASGATNFTYKIVGSTLTPEIVSVINNNRLFYDKMQLIKSYGCVLEYEKLDNNIFRSNLQSIDSNFITIISDILLLYYSTNKPTEKIILNLVHVISKTNPLNYDLKNNPNIYEVIIKRFLRDIALGMTPAKNWDNDYSSMGGYLVVREDGELLCYHFYFMKNFEDYLFKNTKLDTPDPKRHGFGSIYLEDNQYKIKLNLQIRFVK